MNENNHSRFLTVFVVAGVCVFKHSASIHGRVSELLRDTRDFDQTVSGRVFNGLKPVTVFCDHAQCVHSTQFIHLPFPSKLPLKRTTTPIHI